MDFFTTKKRFESYKTEGLLIGVTHKNFSDPVLAAIDKRLGGAMKKSMRSARFEGSPGQTFSIDTLGRHPAAKVVIVGLGKKNEFTLDVIRRASAGGAKAMKSAGVKKYATTLALEPLNKITIKELAQAVCEGANLAMYSFDQLKAEKTKRKVESLTLFAANSKCMASISEGMNRGKATSDGACFARDLINLPGNVVTPSYMANQAKKFSAETGIKCKVLLPKDIKRLKMGGLAGVARGSDEPARFIVMEWMKGPKSQKPIVLVGKGLTFDTGGISLKPSGDMHEMKADMSGGAAVLATLRTAAQLKLKVNLVGLVPSTENMPGGSATKPGDVLTGMSGVTMEVLNTDAEGRLILADGLAYAERYNPDCVIDIATLTGACMVALGSYASGLFGNDDKLKEQIRQAGERTGERMWPMPLWPEYEDDIKSDVADVQNIGPRWGGAITAAAFLKKHVTGAWAHLDIAGTAYSKAARHYISPGGVGLGVRLMIEFIENRAKLKK